MCTRAALLQNGLAEAVQKSRKQIKERKNRTKSLRGVKKSGGGEPRAGAALAGACRGLRVHAETAVRSSGSGCEPELDRWLPAAVWPRVDGIALRPSPTCCRQEVRKREVRLVKLTCTLDSQLGSELRRQQCNCSG